MSGLSLPSSLTLFHLFSIFSFFLCISITPSAQDVTEVTDYETHDEHEIEQLSQVLELRHGHVWRQPLASPSHTTTTTINANQNFILIT